MTNIYYQEQVLENIARKVLCGYDSALYYGSPAAVPIEEMIEAHGVSLEYQYLRKNGRILGKTIFDEGLEAVYDMENREYTLFPVRAGTILIDASLCEEDASTGRLRFTCAHELAHWILHKKLYTGTGRSAAMITEQSETTLEVQANMLGSAILMPSPKSSGASTSSGEAVRTASSSTIWPMCFRCPDRPCASGSPTTDCCKVLSLCSLKREQQEVEMKEKESRTIYCPVCHRGRILDAASQTDPAHLRLFGPRQSAKAEWFTKCPKCGAQIGMIFRREVNIEQQQAGA